MMGARRMTVCSLLDIDLDYFNLVDDKKKPVFPLCDLTVVGKKSSNYQPIKDYCVWFANR